MIDKEKLYQEFEAFMEELQQNYILPDDIENVDIFLHLKNNSTYMITISSYLFRAFVAGEFPSLGALKVADELRDLKLHDLVDELSKIRDDMVKSSDDTVH